MCSYLWYFLFRYCLQPIFLQKSIEAIYMQWDSITFLTANNFLHNSIEESVKCAKRNDRIFYISFFLQDLFDDICGENSIWRVHTLVEFIYCF